jgi:L-ascorbate metabolism protein UlaG (beta-lactamase superfamily)
MASALQSLVDLMARARGLLRSLRGGPGYRGPRSDHFDGKRFFNPGASAGKSLRQLLRWRRTRTPVPWPRWRENRLPPPLLTTPTDGELAITFINHMTCLVQLPGLSLLTDPIFSGRASPVQWAGPRRVHAPGLPIEQLPPVDLVFVSHNHYDHMDLASLTRLQRLHRPLVLTGLGNAAFLREQGIERVEELDWWDSISVSGARALFTPAQHWSSRGPGSTNRTLWGGLWLTAGGRSVYFSGDTGYSPHFRSLRQRCGPPDLALLPIGCYEPRWFMQEQHMNPDDAVRAHLDLGARTSLGTHFGCFPLADEGIDDPLRELARSRLAHEVSELEFQAPEPGSTLVWRGQASGLHVRA